MEPAKLAQKQGEFEGEWVGEGQVQRVKCAVGVTEREYP